MHTAHIITQYPHNIEFQINNNEKKNIIISTKVLMVYNKKNFETKKVCIYIIYMFLDLCVFE